MATNTSNANEQMFLELINSARLDPLGDTARYISSYGTQAHSSVGNIESALDFFNVSGTKLLKQLTALNPAQPSFASTTAGEMPSFSLEVPMNTTSVGPCRRKSSSLKRTRCEAACTSGSPTRHKSSAASTTPAIDTAYAAARLALRLNTVLLSDRRDRTEEHGGQRK